MRINLSMICHAIYGVSSPQPRAVMGRKRGMGNRTAQRTWYMNRNAYAEPILAET